MPRKFMVEKLAASGLTPADVDATDVLDPFNNVPVGFKLPYYRPDGTMHPAMHRVRLEFPPPGRGKYTQPSAEELIKAGHPDSDATHPYLNPHHLHGVKWEDAGRVHPKKLLIVEGEIKAASASKLLQVAAIGIPGCWGGTRKDIRGVHHVHPVVRPLLHASDLIEVVLDGDILTNPDVNRAAGTLKRALGRLGVRPVFVLLPAQPPGVGAGLDDWLMRTPPPDRQRAFAALPRTDGAEFDEDWVSLADYFGLATNKFGIALPTASNLQVIMEKHERFDTRYYYDVMRGTLYRNDPSGPTPFVDPFVFDELVWLQRRTGMLTISKATVQDAITWLAVQPRWRRNRLLESIPPWDGVDRLETMFVRGWGAVDSPYMRGVGRNWLVSAIARASSPGCQVDTMLVLVGKQGIFKSKSLRALADGLYIATHEQVSDKDFRMALHRGWIIDLAELSSMNHTESNAIKAIITDTIDHIRPHYARVSQDMPRHSVMVGTTNEARFLRDPTGNRRFWPVACGKIDMDWITVNRLQLLAEAREKYLAGHDWWTMHSSTEQVQEEHTEIGRWDEAVETYLNGVQTNGRVISVSGVMYRFITTGEILQGLGIDVAHRQAYMEKEISASIRRVGGGKWEHYFCQQRITFPGGGSRDRAKGWKCPVIGTPNATVIDFPPPSTSTLF